MSLTPFKHVWAYGWHFWDLYVASPNSPNEGFNPPLTINPPPPPTPPSITHLFSDITVVLKEGAENPAV